MSNLSKEEFYSLIALHLKEKPDHMEIAIRAILSGVERALQELREMAANTDTAFLCALGLLDSKRLTDDLKNHLNSVIVEKIKKNKSKCELERKFLEAAE